MNLRKSGVAVLRKGKHMIKQKGATMVEYGFMVVLVAIVALVDVAYFGEEVAGLFETAREQWPGDDGDA